MIKANPVKKIIRKLYHESRNLSSLASVPFKRHGLESSYGLERLDNERPVYVFFAPEAGVQPHFVAHCLIAKTLQELGHQVVLVRCFDTYRHCLPIEMRGIPIDRSAAQRANVCLSCAETGRNITKEYDLPTITLDSLLSAEEIADINTTVKAMPPDASKLEIDGIKFGILCGLDLAILTKKTNQSTVTGRDRTYLEAYVQAALISYRAMKKLITQFNVANLAYFNEYSMLMGAVMAAQAAKIPAVRVSYVLHKNADHSKVILNSNSLGIIHYHACLDRWETWRGLPLSPKIIKMITDNQITRMGKGGFSVYSPILSGDTGRLYDQLNLDNNRKILVAYTSSLDEYYANINMMAAVGVDLFQKEQPFVDQIEWLESLIGYVEKSDNYQLVVRIHPREGKTARDDVESDHRTELVKKFSRKYIHTKIVWPEAPISSYDLAEIADVALTSWTNITSETTRLGIPTITAFKRINPFPVDDMVGWAPTPVEYFKLLERTAKVKQDLSAVVYAYRWTNCAHLASYVDLGDLVPQHEQKGVPPFRLPAAASLIERVLCKHESLHNIFYKELLDASGTVAQANELAELKRQLRRVIWFIVFGEDQNQDYILKNGEISKAKENELTIELHNAECLIAINGQVLRKRSKIISRLLPMIAQ